MNPDTHLFLYAKGHYLETEMLADLRVIVGRRCNLLPEHVSESNIALILLGIVHPLLANCGNPENAFIEFVLRIQSGESVISQCLSVMRNARVAELELGEADPRILPLSAPALPQVERTRTSIH